MIRLLSMMLDEKCWWYKTESLIFAFPLDSALENKPPLSSQETPKNMLNAKGPKVAQLLLLAQGTLRL
jgi:hypothetical protein